jgi:tetratricopeptide (TPR) repeat protein
MPRSGKRSKGAKRADKVRKRKQKRRKQAQADTGPYSLDASDLGNEVLEDDFDSFVAPDRRAIEGAMWRPFRHLLGGGATPLAEAQDLMYEAFDVEDPEEQAALAHRALVISPDCADAYVLLAEQADSLDESLKLYEQGVEAGRRALGEAFEQHVGHFWGVIQTRPYMRARAGLADCLWVAGRRDESLAHYQEMLRLNPHDNQGLRYLVAPKLIETGRIDPLEKLFEQYDEDSTNWLYTRALATFRREGDADAARELLAAALEANRHVPKYVTEQRPLPFDLPDCYSPGREDEAQLYTVESRAAWKSVPGALAWLRKLSGVGLGEPESKPARVPVTKLKRLPQDPDETWQLDVRELPGDADDELDEPVWCVVVLGERANQFVASEVMDHKPSPQSVWNILCASMCEPDVGDPRRPGRVSFLDAELLEQLGDRVEGLGVAASLSEHAEEIHAQFEAMRLRQRASADDRPLAELPQVPEEVWQADCRQMGLWLPDEQGNLVRPWVVIVTCPSDDSIVMNSILTEQPSLDDIWKVLEQGMRQPAMGDARRPGCVQVRSPDQRLSLQPRLESVGVACESRGELEHWDFVYTGLARHMEGRRRVTPYVELPGVGREQVASLFEAAAQYYRARPWHRVAVDAVMQVRVGEPAQVWHAVVIGQSGMTFGLALYDEPKGLRRMLRGTAPETAAEHTSGISLTFGEQHDMAGVDLDAAEQFGWPVAAPEAYPLVIRLRPPAGVTEPSADDLRVLEAVLRAVPAFVAAGRSPRTQTVELHGTTAPVTLAWTRL